MQFHRRARGHHARDVRVQVTACIFSRLNGRPNTTATQDEALSATARLRAFLKALKYCRRPDLPERLDIILAEAAALERRDLLLILTYLDKGPVAVCLDTIRQVLHRRMHDREEQIMGWLTQPYFEKGVEEGIRQGRAEGHAEGHAEGQAKSLVRLLERRFGRLPAHLRKRVFAADVQSLDTWFDRAIDAADLQSVFAESLRGAPSAPA